ncbi:MAG: putative triple gene block protein 1 [Beijing sediment alphaflexivirus]|nr:MAG: putative triple gene block protein 1 [Beijing sediment alphaflexivirus]
MEFYGGKLINYQRTGVPLECPIVVHAVAGAGKTTIVRDILRAKPETTAITYGRPDPPNIAGVRIRGPSGDANIVDEYPAADLTQHPSVQLLLADPLQHAGNVKPAHYISTVTHRFGTDTCELLRQLDIDIESDREDQVIQDSAYALDPIGTIIALGKGSEALLRAHHLEYFRPCQVLGATFDTVTVITDRDLAEQDPVSRYVALTRHRNKLLILS